MKRLLKRLVSKLAVAYLSNDIRESEILYSPSIQRDPAVFIVQVLGVETDTAIDLRPHRRLAEKALAYLYVRVKKNKRDTDK